MWFNLGPNGRFFFAELEEDKTTRNQAFLEIKVSRTNRSSVGGKSRWLRLLRADLRKLSRYPCLSFLLAYDFDINGIGADELAALRQSAGPNTKLIYTTAKLPEVFLNAKPGPVNRGRILKFRRVSL